VLYERPAGQTWVISVSLDEAAAIRKALVPDVQPPLMAEEWMANSEQIKADPGFGPRWPGAVSPTCHWSRWIRGRPATSGRRSTPRGGAWRAGWPGPGHCTP
jgi:hypothetical protein